MRDEFLLKFIDEWVSKPEWLKIEESPDPLAQIRIWIFIKNQEPFYQDIQTEQIGSLPGRIKFLYLGEKDKKDKENPNRDSLISKILNFSSKTRKDLSSGNKKQLLASLRAKELIA